jgi:hypothetical protein
MRGIKRRAFKRGQCLIDDFEHPDAQQSISRDMFPLISMGSPVKEIFVH